MKVIVEIPDETAARMFGKGQAEAYSLLELAGYTACMSGRISEYEFMKLLGLETRYELHDVMKRLRVEAEAWDEETVRLEFDDVASLGEVLKTSKSG